MENLLSIWDWDFGKNQKVLFSILAESYSRNADFCVPYDELTEIVVENIQKYNPDATNNSMGGWVAKLNSTLFTKPWKETYVEMDSDRTKEVKSIQVSEVGIEFINKHYDVIEKFIKDNNIKGLN